MKVISEISAFPSSTVSLTIGNFDGVHLGHQALLKQLKGLVHKSCVITFKNHPSEVLKPESPTPLLCTFEHKIKLIREQNIDFLIPLLFTKELAAQTAEEFLQMIRSHCSFSDLLLGPDATIGKDKHGNRNHLKEIASLWGFSLTYLDALTVDGIKISSSKIRETIQKGDLTETEQLLGRKFSIYTKVKTGLGLGKRIGFPTLNMDVEILCLPPFGVYAVKVLHENKSLKGVANLGIAPTVRQDGKPILEVHLLDAIGDIKDGCLMEVILEQYIRPEIRFGNIDQLKLQIAKDIQSALRIL